MRFRLSDRIPRRPVLLLIVGLSIAAAVPIGFGVRRYRAHAEIEGLVRSARFGGNLGTTHSNGRIAPWLSHWLSVLTETDYGPVPGVAGTLRHAWWMLGEPTTADSAGPGIDLGKLIPKLGRLSGLESVKLDSSGAIGSELGYLAGSERLTKLWLRGMHVSPAAVGRLDRLERLEDLNLQNSTGIDDEAAGRIARLSRLQRLSVAGTAITDAGVERLSSLRGLERISLWRTQVTDESVPALVRMAPREINVTGTGLTADGLTRLRRELPASEVESDLDRPGD